MTSGERQEVFGEVMSVERRLAMKIEAAAKCARSKISWQILLVFVGLAVGAIGFVWVNLGMGISENRTGVQDSMRGVVEIRGEVQGLRESFEDFRAEQRATNREMMMELGAIRKQLPKGE